ncbi:MAG TPA: NAD(P)/FAD-dependent oxidoreductase [Actinomycetota bacterium]|nr:NAD(P)/FAD-dependent oxidoreductase [Actinomycetota bacterium]
MAATKVLIVGGGYVGLYSALALKKRAREAEITLVSPESNMTYQPFLPEAASGNIEPRHVVIPLRTVLKGVRLVTGRVTAIDHTTRRARVEPIEGAGYDVDYTQVILGAGSISRVLPVPGLPENAVGFKTVGEAIYLRNHVLSCMDAAESTNDPAVKKRALAFTFVGGGYAGVEALAELEDLARDACRYYSSVTRDDMRWVLVEAAGGILPEIGEGLGEYALERLRKRSIETYLNTRLEGATGGVMTLSNGETFESDTLVWTTGVKAHPLMGAFGFSTDKQGRIEVDECMRVKGAADAWAAGDCAAVPDLTTGGVCPPTAQHALRQARRLGKNVAAVINGGEPKPFKYKNRGGLVSLGRYKGVASVMGLRLRGFPAWFLHRTYHVIMVPTINRRARILVDWTVALFFRRDVVQLGSLTQPREAFIEATSSLVDVRKET